MIYLTLFFFWYNFRNVEISRDHVIITDLLIFARKFLKRTLLYLGDVLHTPRIQRGKYKPNCRNQKHILSAEYRMHTVSGSTIQVCQKKNDFLKSFWCFFYDAYIHKITRYVKDVIENRERERPPFDKKLKKKKWDWIFLDS